jgi:hypothetical protein
MKAAPTFMGKRYKNLFNQIVSDENLWSAYLKSSNGKRQSLEYLRFKQNDIANLALLKSALLNKTYAPSEPRNFTVYEPKEREISALPFVDRIVQHAICNIIGPIFEKTFLPNSYACRDNKGTHAAAKQVQALLRKTDTTWVLKTDFSKYFASIDKSRLYTEITRKISCKETLSLLNMFISESGKGVSIGNLTSQLAANIYGHIIDRWLIHDAKINTFVRYMDDIVIISDRKDTLLVLFDRMNTFICDDMNMKFSRWSITEANRGVNFCGYRLWKDYKLLRKQSVIRAKRKIIRYSKLSDTSALNKFIAAWMGHMNITNSFHLRQHFQSRGLLQ